MKMSKYHYNLIKWNLDKYDCPPVEYNKFQIFLLMENANTHLVSVFKDHLLYDDTTEFFKEYYKSNQINKRLKSIFEYYESSSYLFPNYTALYEGKYIYKNIIKKQKLIDYIEHLEDLKQEQDKEKNKEKHKEQTSNNQKNNPENNSSNSYVNIFDTIVYNDIIKETANNSKINEIFCIDEKNLGNGDSVSSLLKLTEQMHSKMQKDKNVIKIYVSRHAKRKINKTKECLTTRNDRFNYDLNTERVNTANNNSQSTTKKLTINISNNFKDKIHKINKDNIIINYNNQNINNCYIENNFISTQTYSNLKTEPSRHLKSIKSGNLDQKSLQKNKVIKKILTTKKLTINIPNNLKFIKHQRLQTDFLNNSNKIKSPINNQSKTNIRNKILYKSKNLDTYTKSINRNILKNINLTNMNKHNQDVLTLSKNHQKHFSTNSYNFQNYTALSNENKMQIIKIKCNAKRKMISKDKKELFTQKIQHSKNRKTAFASTIGMSVSSKKLHNENSNSNSTNKVNKSNNLIGNKSKGINNRKKHIYHIGMNTPKDTNLNYYI